MLRLVDLLLVCNEDMEISIFDNECESIGRYNGTESVEQELKYQFVEWVFPQSNNVLNIGLVCKWRTNCVPTMN